MISMKEWKGNKNSVASMIGFNTVCHPEEREPNDFYSTDPVAVRMLIERLQTDKKTVIYECACGTGNISRELESMGYTVISTDLIDRGYGTPGIDFLQVNTIPDNCMILTNPPYKYTTEFIEHSISLLPMGGVAAFLLNISYLSGQARYRNIYAKKDSGEGLYLLQKNPLLQKRHHYRPHIPGVLCLVFI